jgi:hypothetical protein
LHFSYNEFNFSIFLRLPAHFSYNDFNFFCLPADFSYNEFKFLFFGACQRTLATMTSNFWLMPGGLERVGTKTCCEGSTACWYVHMHGCGHASVGMDEALSY